MKIKTIDLLNKISDNEGIPNRIYYSGNVYEYDRETQNYYKSLSFTKDWLIGEDITALLNDEVEIIEEDKKIEKLLLDMNCKRKGDMTADYANYMLSDIVEHNFDVIHKKFNELIDEINKLKEK